MAAPAEPPVDELAAFLYKEFEATEVPRLAAAHAAQQQAVTDAQSEKQALAAAKERAAAAKRAKYGTEEDPRVTEFDAIMARAGIKPTGRTLKPGRLFEREDRTPKVLRLAHPSVREAEKHAKMTPEQVAKDKADKEAKKQQNTANQQAGKKRAADGRARAAEEAKNAKPELRSLVAIREAIGTEMQAFHVRKRLGEDTPEAVAAHEAKLSALQDEELRKIAEGAPTEAVASHEGLAGLNCPWSPSGTFLTVDLRYSETEKIQTVIAETQRHVSALKENGQQATPEFREAHDFLVSMRAETKRRHKEEEVKRVAERKRELEEDLLARQEMAMNDPANYRVYLKGANEFKWWQRDGFLRSETKRSSDASLQCPLGDASSSSDNEEEKEQSGALIPATYETEEM